MTRGKRKFIVARGIYKLLMAQEGPNAPAWEEAEGDDKQACIEAADGLISIWDALGEKEFAR